MDKQETPADRLKSALWELESAILKEREELGDKVTNRLLSALQETWSIMPQVKGW